MTPRHVEGREHDDAGRRQRQREPGQVLRIEQGDDDDGAEVVEDGKRQQEQLERARHPRPQQRQHAHGEGDVGGRRNGPALERDGVAGVDPDVDERRHRHAADGRHRGQGGLAEGRQLSPQQLALDLEADQEEEDRHQAVVDPQQQRLVDRQRADAHAHGRVEKYLVEVRQRRVVEDERGDCRRHQHDAGRSLVLEEGQGALELVAWLGRGCHDPSVLTLEARKAAARRGRRWRPARGRDPRGMP